MKPHRSDNDIIIEKLLHEVQIRVKENEQMIERVAYFALLSKVLGELDDKIKKNIALYFQQTNNRIPAISFQHGAEGYMIWQAFQEIIFPILYQSQNHYGHEFRNINGLGLEYIDAIDLTELGIPAILPKDLNYEPNRPFGSVAKLKDIDSIRMNEWQSILITAETDDQRKIVQSTLSGIDGIRLSEIF